MSILPEMAKISLEFQTTKVENVVEDVENKLKKIQLPFKQDARIGVAVGSRGITDIKPTVKTLVQYLQGQGFKPVIIPAMGSHGGATSEGQIEVLAAYGITEAEINAPIEATMDTVCLGNIKGDIPVYYDKIASSLDGIFLVNRVKPHTDFRAVYESGVVKQLVVGLGNHIGAQSIHSYGLYGLEVLMEKMAALILEKIPNVFGVAILENADDDTAEIEILSPDNMLSKEPELLKKAHGLIPKLPVQDVDLLIVEEIGKNISGVGIDPNVTGRVGIRFSEDWQEDLTIRRIVALDLTPESYGNALGIGLADIITDRLHKKIDFEKTYKNVLTSTFLERGFMPIVQPSDKDAIQVALSCSGRKITKETTKILQIRNTLYLQEVYVSLPLLEEMNKDANWKLIEEFEYQFSSTGDLLNLIKN